MNRRIIALAATFAAVGLATPALAGTGPAQETRKEVVSYSDLNLATAKGQDELQKRIDDASRRVCRFDKHGRIVTPTEEFACRVSVRESTERQFAQVMQDNTLGG